MKKILIADDSAFMRTVIRDMLRGLYELVEAESGQGCIDQFHASAPDLVLLDIVMPGGDREGLRVLRRLVADRPSARVVMITALGPDDPVVKECLKSGAKACLPKPFDNAEVMRTIEAALR